MNESIRPKETRFNVRSAIDLGERKHNQPLQPVTQVTAVAAMTPALRSVVLLAALLSLVAPACCCSDPPSFPNLRSSYNRPITTADDRTQGHFSDGLVNWFGFNRHEAIRSFTHALQCDPKCAMCEWGIAIVNAPFMNEKQVSGSTWRTGAQAISRAVALAADGHATPIEAGLIQAFVARHSEEGNQTPDSYVASMRKLAADYPEDTDVGVFFISSLAAAQGYRFHSNPATQKGHTVFDGPNSAEIFDRLQSLLPTAHPLVLQLYIHVTESLAPGPGPCADGAQCAAVCEPAANVLASRVADSGHLLHMPSHCFMRLGRYADAAKSSARAARVNHKALIHNFQPYDPPMHIIGAMCIGAMYAGQLKVSTLAAKWLTD